MHPTQKPADRLDLSPADVLRYAALYVQRHGFHQGDMFADYASQTPAACAQGAVKMAICGHPRPTYTPHEGALFDETMQVLAGHVDPAFDPCGTDEAGAIVADWSDTPGRTADQLVTALIEAADEYDTYQNRLDAAYTANRAGNPGGAE